MHVHCKDVRRDVLERCRNRDTSFLDAVLDGVFTVPGDGMVDYRSVLEPIARSGYSGWLVVEAEQDPAVASAVQYAQLGFQNLSALVQACASLTGRTSSRLGESAAFLRAYCNASITSFHDTYLKFCRCAGIRLRPSCTTSRPAGSRRRAAR